MIDPKPTPAEKALLEKILAFIKARDLAAAEQLMRKYLEENPAPSTYSQRHRELRNKLNSKEDR
jgi:DNA-binding FadR family transcriptional regulator